MINKIGNWVFGSFFRTIGRLLVFVLLGFIIANLVDFSDIISNFRITDLFFEKVNAAEVSVPVIPFPGEYFFNAQEWSNFNVTSDSTMAYKTITSNNDLITNYIQFQTDSIASQNYDYIEFTYSFSDPLIVTTTTTVPGQDYCERWTWGAMDSYNNVIRWDCARVNQTDSYSLTNIYNEEIDQFNFSFEVEYTNGGHNTCTANGNKVLCPVYKNQISKLYIYTNFKTKRSTTFDLYISRRVAAYIINNVSQAIDNNTNAITNQTEQQQQQHEEMMDSNTTQAQEEAEGFFGDFSVPDTGGLSGIITAPLNTIRSLLNSTCTNLVLPLPFVNENLTLPCLYDIYSEHFGAFFSIYQTIILAIVAYRCIRSIYFDIHGFMDPNDDRIEVMDL